MFYELRQYRTKPGQLDNWVNYMENVIMPFQISKGMVITGSFIGVEEDNLYIWMRRFKNEEERANLYESVYESDVWKNDMLPNVIKMLDRDKTVVTRIRSTEKSVSQ